jgi:hypothetical protein
MAGDYQHSQKSGHMKKSYGSIIWIPYYTQIKTLTKPFCELTCPQQVSQRFSENFLNSKNNYTVLYSQ